MSQRHQDVRKAEFSERALAFGADYALFAGVWFLILKAVDPAIPVLLNEKGIVVTAFLIGLFLVYQAFFSCEGRSTFGKRLLGIRVASAEGEPLDLGRAVMRSIAYVPSSFLTLGFFWALIDPKGRAWHDLAAGSGVVSDHPAGRIRGPILRFAAGTLVVAFALGVGWNGIWEPRYLKLMAIAHAKAGLVEVNTLQAAYHQRNGRYAGSLFDLAEVSSNPRAFLYDMAVLYDLKAFQFKIDKTKWAVATRARDVDSTLIAAHGP